MSSKRKSPQQRNRRSPRRRGTAAGTVDSVIESGGGQGGDGDDETPTRGGDRSNSNTSQIDYDGSGAPKSSTNKERRQRREPSGQQQQPPRPPTEGRGRADAPKRSLSQSGEGGGGGRAVTSHGRKQSNTSESVNTARPVTQQNKQQTPSGQLQPQQRGAGGNRNENASAAAAKQPGPPKHIVAEEEGKRNELVDVMVSRLGQLLRAEEDFESRYIAAVKIQCLIRGFVARCKITRKKLIRSRAAIYRQVREKGAAGVVIDFFKMLVARRIERQHQQEEEVKAVELRDQAATKIQSVARRWLAKQYVKRLKVFYKNYNRALKTLQCWFRRCLARGKVHRMRAARDDAQSAKLDLERRSHAAAEVQRIFRSHLAAAATGAMKRQARAARERDRASHRTVAAKKIQSYWRGCCDRAATHAVRAEAERIHQLRLVASNRRQAAQTIQSFWRSCTARKRTAPLMAAFLERRRERTEARRHLAARTIQCLARNAAAKKRTKQRLVEKTLRAFLDKTSHAAPMLQAYFRAATSERQTFRRGQAVFDRLEAIIKIKMEEDEILLRQQQALIEEERRRQEQEARRQQLADIAARAEYPEIQERPHHETQEAEDQKENDVAPLLKQPPPSKAAMGQLREGSGTTTVAPVDPTDPGDLHAPASAVAKDESEVPKHEATTEQQESPAEARQEKQTDDNNDQQEPPPSTQQRDGEQQYERIATPEPYVKPERVPTPTHLKLSVRYLEEKRKQELEQRKHRRLVELAEKDSTQRQTISDAKSGRAAQAKAVLDSRRQEWARHSAALRIQSFLRGCVDRMMYRHKQTIVDGYIEELVNLDKFANVAPHPPALHPTSAAAKKRREDKNDDGAPRRPSDFAALEELSEKFRPQVTNRLKQEAAIAVQRVLRQRQGTLARNALALAALGTLPRKHKAALVLGRFRRTVIARCTTRRLRAQRAEAALTAEAAAEEEEAHWGSMWQLLGRFVKGFVVRRHVATKWALRRNWAAMVLAGFFTIIKAKYLAARRRRILKERRDDLQRKEEAQLAAQEAKAKAVAADVSRREQAITTIQAFGRSMLANNELRQLDEARRVEAAVKIQSGARVMKAKKERTRRQEAKQQRWADLDKSENPQSKQSTPTQQVEAPPQEETPTVERSGPDSNNDNDAEQTKRQHDRVESTAAVKAPTKPKAPPPPASEGAGNGGGRRGRRAMFADEAPPPAKAAPEDSTRVQQPLDGDYDEVEPLPTPPSEEALQEQEKAYAATVIQHGLSHAHHRGIATSASAEDLLPAVDEKLKQQLAAAAEEQEKGFAVLKVQCLLRTALARKALDARKAVKAAKDAARQEGHAAEVIQKGFRGHLGRKQKKAGVVEERGESDESMIPHAPSADVTPAHLGDDETHPPNDMSVTQVQLSEDDAAVATRQEQEAAAVKIQSQFRRIEASTEMKRRKEAKQQQWQARMEQAAAEEQ